MCVDKVDRFAGELADTAQIVASDLVLAVVGR